MKMHQFDHKYYTYYGKYLSIYCTTIQKFGSVRVLLLFFFLFYSVRVHLVTVKDIYNVKKKAQINVVLFNFLSKNIWFITVYIKMISTTVFNIENNKKCVFNSKCIRMTSKGSRDTEDSNNNAKKFSFAIT